jgi:hypothetical protein
MRERGTWSIVRRGLLLAVVVVAMLCGASAAGAAPKAPDSTTQPLKDGCQRSPVAMLAGQSPEWAYVYNTPASQPAPPPRWVTGTVSSGNPAFQAVHTSGGDNPAGHEAYDFNVNIAPDAGDTYLLATGNYAGSGEETGRLHTEWEDLTIPKFAWPEPGDRVMQRGSWVWDCGHWGTPTNVFSPDYWLPKEGQPCPGIVVPDPSQCKITGERTEFHPYRAIWDQRAQSPNGARGENEAELFISTEKTKAGKEADCAHKNPPPPGSATYGPGYAACVEAEPNWQDVSGRYSFFLPAPPKPSADAQLVYRAVDRGSANGARPKLTPTATGLQVSFGLDSPPTQRTIMAYTFFVGWSPVPASTVPAHLRVSFDRLEVHRAMDPGCSAGVAQFPDCQYESTRQNQLTTAPGDWNLYLDVNGIWGQWGSGNGEFLTQDGQVLDNGPTVDLYVPPGKGWRLFVHGRECDLNALDPANPMADCPTNRELADDNDVQGEVLDAYPSAAASLGTHTDNAATSNNDPTSTCPDSNALGCYTLSYTVSLVDDAASRTGPTP